MKDITKIRAAFKARKAAHTVVDTPEPETSSISPAEDDDARATATLAARGEDIIRPPQEWLRSRGFLPGDLSRPNLRADGKVRTAMHEAAGEGELGVCRWLFTHGAASTIRRGVVNSANGRVRNYTPMYAGTPMYAACAAGHLDVVKWLFEMGAVEDIRTQTFERETPMHAACQGGHLDVAEWLWQKLQELEAYEDIRARDTSGWTPMHAACSNGHLNMAKWLFEAGAAEDIRAVNVYGVTPLYAACGRHVQGHLHVARWLFELGAGVALPAACARGSTGAATLLALQGAAHYDEPRRWGSRVSDPRLRRVDLSLIGRVVPVAMRASLRASLGCLVDTHAVFFSVVLPAVVLSAGRAPGVRPQSPPDMKPSSSSSLSLPSSSSSSSSSSSLLVEAGMQAELQMGAAGDGGAAAGKRRRVGPLSSADAAARSSLSCPQGHPLLAVTTPGFGSECAACSSVLKEGAAVYSCRACDHDLCAACAVPTPASVMMVEPWPQRTWAKTFRSSPADASCPCALRLLRGHEDSVLQLIADFAGVVRGRELRNARDVFMALDKLDIRKELFSI